MQPQNRRGQKCISEWIAMRLCKAPKRHQVRVDLVFSYRKDYHC